MLVNWRHLLPDLEQGIRRRNECTVVPHRHLLHLPPYPFRIYSQQFRFLRQKPSQSLPQFPNPDAKSSIMRAVRIPYGGDQEWRIGARRRKAAARRMREGGDSTSPSIRRRSPEIQATPLPSFLKPWIRSECVGDLESEILSDFSEISRWGLCNIFNNKGVIL